ncbi:hypothetical protein BDZ94DRAFT_703360 [Collybia nuda]|uniref:Uncharacterized protein n=1 Tax=Collybia nuda TaxID=64659 RepID=A0A9P5Y5Q0_9AGAR|nr:hypothetical protein BDZ94DRAFT_703360 [Collybia nuda]
MIMMDSNQRRINDSGCGRRSLEFAGRVADGKICRPAGGEARGRKEVGDKSENHGPESGCMRFRFRFRFLSSVFALGSMLHVLRSCSLQFFASDPLLTKSYIQHPTIHPILRTTTHPEVAKPIRAWESNSHSPTTGMGLEEETPRTKDQDARSANGWDPWGVALRADAQWTRILVFVRRPVSKTWPPAANLNQTQTLTRKYNPPESEPKKSESLRA